MDRAAIEDGKLDACIELSGSENEMITFVSIVRTDTFLPGWNPFVTSINMNGANGSNDCIAYITKIALSGSNWANGIYISASAGGYVNTNFVLDNVRHGIGTGDNDYTGLGWLISEAITPITNANPGVFCTYIDGIESNSISLPHITNAVNVAGYICWGQHSNWGTNLWDGNYPIDGEVQWLGSSGWWIIRTEESFNGERYQGQGSFVKWYSSSAFGGTNYSNTPIGAVSYTDEPGAEATDNGTYFSLWAAGKSLAICAWNSSQSSPYIQTVGDPFVRR